MLSLAVAWILCLRCHAVKFCPPGSLVIRGHDVPVAPKELALFEMIRTRPQAFASYRSVHEWTGWKTAFDLPRVRLLIKPLNLKTLEYAGTMVLRDDRARAGLALVLPPPAPAGEDKTAKLSLWLRTKQVDPSGHLKMSEAEYLGLGLPRAELLKTLSPLATPLGFTKITISLLTFSSTTEFGSPNRSHWYPQGPKHRCRFTE